MRLFIENVSAETLKPTCLEEYKFNEKKHKYILSEEGIIKCEKQLIPYFINDVDPYKIFLKNCVLICDESQMIKGNQVYNIQKNHFCETITKTKYRLRPKALVNFVYEVNDNNVKTMYFETYEHPETIQGDIDTFLSLLNFTSLV